MIDGIMVIFVLSAAAVVWPVWMIIKPTYFLVLFALPLLIYMVVGGWAAIANVIRLYMSDVEHAIESRLKVEKGHARETVPFPPTKDKKMRLLFFFESGCDWIEGTITIRCSMPPLIREFVIQLRPKWRRFFRKRFNKEPIEFLVDDLDGEVCSIIFDVEIGNRRFLMPNQNRSEDILILIMKQTF